MLRILTYLVLLVYLSCATELHEIFKIGNLIAHFLEHKGDDEANSFQDFLHMHYAGEDAHETEHEGENELPFKSHQFQTPVFKIPAVFPAITHCLTVVPEVFLINTPPSPSQPVISAYLENIWQPPKQI